MFLVFEPNVCPLFLIYFWKDSSETSAICQCIMYFSFQANLYIYTVYIYTYIVMDRNVHN